MHCLQHQKSSGPMEDVRLNVLRSFKYIEALKYVPKVDTISINLQEKNPNCI